MWRSSISSARASDSPGPNRAQVVGVPEDQERAEHVEQVEPDDRRLGEAECCRKQGEGVLLTGRKAGTDHHLGEDPERDDDQVEEAGDPRGCERGLAGAVEDGRRRHAGAGPAP